MRLLLSISVLLSLAATIEARPAAPTMHPAVVRVAVRDDSSTMSLGSGALVAVSDQYGLVVTNWHVVRDGDGTATVIFPDGFRSAATVTRVDRDWDLAALVIWRPRVQPIPLATRRPRIGEPLWIAGYGKGAYRMVGGRCTQYLSPGGRLPFDMIELSAGARQGDSGGPILNQQGQLAGVLFGAAWGKTSGSHCLRVRQFLHPVMKRFDAMPTNDPTMIAACDRHPPARGPASSARRAPTATIAANGGSPARTSGWRSNGGRPASGVSPPEPAEGDSVPWRPRLRGKSGFVAPPQPGPREARPVEASTPVPGNLWEDGRSILAIIGLLAICFHTLRWIAK